MKQISVLVALFFSASALFAQQAKIGVKAGVSVPKWNVSSDFSSGLSISSYPGLEIGVLGDFPISKSVSIQPEISYSSLGTKMSSGGDNVKYRLDYITVPLLAKYSLPNGFGIYAGPQVGFLLSAKGKFSNSGEKEDVKSALKSTDFFITFGTEYNFQNGIAVYARYNHGLVNIYDIDADGSIHNTSFGFGLAYKINAPKRK